MTVTAAQRPRVLVADDDADILALVSDRLEHAGYDVMTAVDGEEALEKALRRRPDLAVLDVRMPLLNGYGVTRGIRDDERTCAMPVILLTAQTQDAGGAGGFDSGADGYIQKPLSPQELPARVHAVLKRR